MTDLYSEQQTGMRFSAFPLLVPHKHVPGHSRAGAAGQTLLIEGFLEKYLLKEEIMGQGVGLPTRTRFLTGNITCILIVIVL